MDPKDIINTGKEIVKLNQIKSKNKFINIKSVYILKRLFGIMQTKISLKIIKYNINIQKRLNINPLTSPGEVVSVFTSPHLSTGAPAQGEAKGLILIITKISLKNFHQLN